MSGEDDDDATGFAGFGVEDNESLNSASGGYLQVSSSTEELSESHPRTAHAFLEQQIGTRPRSGADSALTVP